MQDGLKEQCELGKTSVKVLYYWCDVIWPGTNTGAQILNVKMQSRFIEGVQAVSLILPFKPYMALGFNSYLSKIPSYFWLGIIEAALSQITAIV